MHRESSHELVFHSYSDVRIERPLIEDIQEVRLRHETVIEEYNEEVNQFEETAC
jgi:uridine kinase